MAGLAAFGPGCFVRLAKETYYSPALVLDHDEHGEAHLLCLSRNHWLKRAYLGLDLEAFEMSKNESEGYRIIPEVRAALAKAQKD